MHTIDSSRRHCAAIAKQIKSTHKIITALTIGNNPLSMLTRFGQRSLPRHFDYTFEQNMHRLARWSPLLFFGEQAHTTIILFYLRLTYQILQHIIPHTL